MAHHFSSVDEYIAGFDVESQKLLTTLRKIIQKHIPDDTEETINYNMPTYRWNGNLIHFALFKKHIGLYPGPAAIQAFSSDLKVYKTTKGAIQFPLSLPFPEHLIQNIILFNVDLLKSKRTGTWDIYRDKWRDAYQKMDKLILQTALIKTHKWGTDVYTYNKKNVVAWNGFKDFFSIWFYNGVFLSDPYEVLVNASDGKTKSLRQWRFKDVAEMDQLKIMDYIVESIQTVKDGKEIKAEKMTLKQPEELFEAMLKENEGLAEAFAKLTPGRQKDYILYIEEAKQEKTKLSRLEKIKPMIRAGVGLHDKYKR